MPIKTVLSIVSGIVLLIAFIPYIKAIVRRETSPRKATWLIWASCDIIILAGMLVQHKVNGLLVGAVFGASTTFVLSLLYGEKGWTKRDKVCITLATLAIVLWRYFGDSNVGIALSSTALFIAAWPTYLSAWERPENEDRKAWVIFNASSLLGVLAIPHLTFADAVPPIVFLTIDCPMLYLIFVRPYFARNAATRVIAE
jgi:hypothetical protein